MYILFSFSNATGLVVTSWFKEREKHKERKAGWSEHRKKKWVSQEWRWRRKKDWTVPGSARTFLELLNHVLSLLSIEIVLLYQIEEWPWSPVMIFNLCLYHFSCLPQRLWPGTQSVLGQMKLRKVIPTWESNSLLYPLLQWCLACLLDYTVSDQCLPDWTVYDPFPLESIVYTQYPLEYAVYDDFLLTIYRIINTCYLVLSPIAWWWHVPIYNLLFSF